jgi:hypothetical protein
VVRVHTLLLLCVIGVLYADEIALVWFTSLGQLIKIINDNQMNYVVDQLIEFLGGKEDELRDIAGLGTSSHYLIHEYMLMTLMLIFIALKTITSELPLEGKTTGKTVEKLVPRLLKQLTTVHIFHSYLSSITHSLTRSRSQPPLKRSSRPS